MNWLVITVEGLAYVHTLAMLAFPSFSGTPTEACPSYLGFWNYCHYCRVCKYMVPSLSSLTSSTFILSVRKL